MPLTPEQIKALGLTEKEQKLLSTPAKDTSSASNGGMMTPDQQAFMDTDVGNNIKRQHESNVFDGSTYESTGMDNVNPIVDQGINVASKFAGLAVPGLEGPANALMHSLIPNSDMSQKNMDLYSKEGDSSIGPVRFQHETDPETGDKSTYFVPPPGMSPAARVVTGGALDLARTTGSFAEWAIKNMGDSVPILGQLKWALKIGDLLGHPEIGDQKVNWINENLPQVPAQNDLERVGQEIFSIAAGALTGGTEATAITKLPKVEQGIASLARGFTEFLGKSGDTANVAQKVQTFIKAALIETGSNLGATVGTPSGSGSVTGGVFENAGMDKHSANRVGIFADNMLASGLLGVGKKFIGMGKDLFTDAFLHQAKGGETSKKALLINTLRTIDPNLEGASPEEFAKRAKSLSDIIQSNKDMGIKSFETPDRQPTEALFTKDKTTGWSGARQYIEANYGFKKRTMKPAEWENWATQQARLIQNNFAQLRRGNLSSTIVQGADSDTNAAVEKGMSTAANDFASPQEVEGAVGKLAAPAIATKNQIDTDLSKATQANITAQQHITDTHLNNPILAKVSDPDVDPFGRTTDISTERNKMMSDLGEGGSAARDKVNQDFAMIPRGNHNWDKERFAKLLLRAYKSPKTIAENLGFTSARKPKLITKPFILTPEDKAAGATDLSETLDLLDNVSLQKAFTEVRPKISEALNTPFSKEQMGERKALMDARDHIDKMAEDSGDPEFEQAMQGYRDYKGTFEPNQELADFQHDARSSIKRQGIDSHDVIIKGRQVLENALNGSDPSGIKLEDLANSMVAGGTPEAKKYMAQSVVDNLISSISREAEKSGTNGMKLTTSRALATAMAKHANVVHQLDPAIYDMYQKAYQELEAAEHGSKEAASRLIQLQKDSQKKLGDLEADIATQFVKKQGDKFVGPTEDYGPVFKRIFSSADSTEDLMARAKGDPVLERAIQAQYLRTMGDQIFTVRPISAVGDGGMVHEASQATLKKVSPDAADQTPTKVMDKIFENNPKMKGDLHLLLDELKKSSEARSMQPNTFGSNTATENVRQRAVMFLLSSTIGILNRTATTIGRGTGLITRQLMERDKKLQTEVLPSLLVNSNYLSDIIDSVVKDSSKENVDKIARRLLSPSFSNPIVKGAVNAQRPEVYDQTDQAFGPVNITIHGGNNTGKRRNE
jgi:hypothetical protein